jgi:hypothetical protein
LRGASQAKKPMASLYLNPALNTTYNQLSNESIEEIQEKV